MSGVRVVPPAAEHRADWERLYAGYAAFYGVEQTAAMRATVSSCIVWASSSWPTL